MEKFIAIILCLIVGARAFYPKCDAIDYEINCMCHPDMEVSYLHLLYVLIISHTFLTAYTGAVLV